MHIRLSIAAAALLASSGVWGAIPDQDEDRAVVTAQPAQDYFIRRVAYRDLNLASAEGEKLLHNRVGNAVRSVCLEATGPNPLEWAESSCRQQAWRDVRPQIKQALTLARQLAARGEAAVGPMSIRIAVARR